MRSLERWMIFCWNVYGQRNRFFLPSLGKRLAFLNLAIGDWETAWRKDVGPEKTGLALSRVFTRIFCVAEFLDLNFISAMSLKYPIAGCAYCGKLPCQCRERRANPVIGAATNSVQSNWTISNWADHLAVVYGQKNKAQGMNYLIGRLFRESCELQSLFMDMEGQSSLSLAEQQNAAAMELSDLTAWSLGIKTLAEIDLEAVLSERFLNGCWKCGKNPCQCTVFNMKPVDWEHYPLA